MNSKVSTEVIQIPPRVEFENMGLGTMRASGTYIALMLQLEEPEERAGILMHVAKAMGIPLQDLIDEYNNTMCVKCGMSMVLHKQNHGQCF